MNKAFSEEERILHALVAELQYTALCHNISVEELIRKANDSVMTTDEYDRVRTLMRQVGLVLERIDKL